MPDRPPTPTPLEACFREAELRLLANLNADLALAEELTREDGFLELFADPASRREARRLLLRAELAQRQADLIRPSVPAGFELPRAPEAVGADLQKLKLARAARRAAACAQELTRAAREALELGLEDAAKARAMERELNRWVARDAWSATELARLTVDWLEERARHPGRTGFEGLDVMTAGLVPGSLALLRGLPSTGRTTFALQVALHAADQGHRVLWVAASESAESVGARCLALRSGLEPEKVRRPKLHREQWLDLARGFCELGELPLGLEVSTEPGSLLPQVDAACRREQPRLVVVDDLPWRGGRLRQAVQDLRALTRELDLTLWATTPAACERPGSPGDVDVDMTLLESIDADDRRPYDTALEVSRSRFGPCGTLELSWNPATATFLERGLRDRDASEA